VDKFAQHEIYVKKQMKAEEKSCEVFAKHTSRHTSPVDGDLVDSRKAPRSSPLKAPCLHLSQKYFDYQKTEGAGIKPPREAARSINSREFCFEIWERESAPANYCVVRRLSLGVGCPSMPSKILVGDRAKPVEHTTVYIAAFCHVLVECSMCVWFIIIV
jgi:hypothetical protein